MSNVLWLILLAGLINIAQVATINWNEVSRLPRASKFMAGIMTIVCLVVIVLTYQQEVGRAKEQAELVGSLTERHKQLVGLIEKVTDLTNHVKDDSTAIGAELPKLKLAIETAGVAAVSAQAAADQARISALASESAAKSAEKKAAAAEENTRHLENARKEAKQKWNDLVNGRI